MIQEGRRRIVQAGKKVILPCLDRAVFRFCFSCDLMRLSRLARQASSASVRKQIDYQPLFQTTEGDRFRATDTKGVTGRKGESLKQMLTSFLVCTAKLVSNKPWSHSTKPILTC